MKKNLVVIIDYGSGNIRSAAKAFEHVVATHEMDCDVLISADPLDLKRASHIVLPGQGAFGDCINSLRAVPAMIEALEEAVLKDKKPFLGICVGMQLLATKGFEYGEHEGLNWIEGEIVPIEPTDKALKIPHMGWNICEFPQENNHPVLNNIKKTGPHFYFVHSFMFNCKDRQNILGTVTYGGDVTAIVGRDNIIGVQFHPEKSQEAGLTLLHNFLLWNGQ